MTEIRTTSSTGGEKGVKPEMHSLVPRKGIAAIARVFGFGSRKYKAHNWRRKYEWSKSFDALYRHIDEALDGNTYDEESGLPHLAHAGFHILVLLTWLEEDGEGVDNPFDDRWPAALERMCLEEEAAEETQEAEQEAGGDAPKFEFHLYQDGPKPALTPGGIIHQMTQAAFERRGEHFPHLKI